MLSSNWPSLSYFAFKQNVRLSNPAHQNQDQKDDNHKAQSATAVVAGPIKWTAPKSAEPPKQEDNQDDQQNGSNRNKTSPCYVDIYSAAWACSLTPLSASLVRASLVFFSSNKVASRSLTV